MTSPTELENLLALRLRDPRLRKAREAGRRAFSPELAYGRHSSPAFRSSKLAAVLVLLEPREDQWTIPLTVRPQHLPDHPGQVCFPGGSLEAGETARQAALREFHEELGTKFQGRIVGELLPIFVYNSNYSVSPFLAIADSSHKYVPCDYEVERVLHLPIQSLHDDGQRRIRDFQRGSVCWKAPTILHHQDHVWGATAMMLGELAALVSDVAALSQS